MKFLRLYMFNKLKALLSGRGMLAFRYRGTIIRTSAFKLFFLGVLTISMVMFMRLQGLFLAMPVAQDKQHSASVFPHSKHVKHQIPYRIFTPFPRETASKSTYVNDEKKSSRARIPVSATSNYVPPSIEISTEAPIDIEKVRQLIELSNRQQIVRNLDKFPGPLTDDSMIIIIQIHNRPDYFLHLLKSLSRAKGIENALLITSHDYYNDYINKMVDSIKFCKVIQIFFPYSMQLYPNKFPGTDPRDCPRDATKEKAKELGCVNAEHPDKYGHFREAKFTMTKHHWWWKANQVFDGLNITKNYNGPVVFLEEDHYISPDFYHVLQLLYQAKLKDSHCVGGCDIMTLGTYTVPPNYKVAGEDAVELLPWKSVRHNMGMAFDRKTWNSIKDCKETFCKYDDYNWDWTLMKISLSCFKAPFRALVMKAPRVFHIGECGMHHKKKKKCNPEQATVKFNTIINENENSFFPASLKVETKNSNGVSPGTPNGGWGDTRDHALCLDFVKT